MSTASRRGLGRGFEALISKDFDKGLLVNSDERIEKIPLEKLRPNPNQPRRHFDEAALNELSISVKRHGIIQPIIITPLSEGKYTLIAGERRWRAAQVAGLATIPAIIRARQELEQLEIALIENVQRVDLNPLEQAVSIERLRDQFSLSYEDIAKRLGKATSTVNNIVRLLGLPKAASKALTLGKISEGHARAILALKGDNERQAYLLETIISQGWSVRQAERFVLSVKAGNKEPEKARAHVATETDQTRALAKSLGTPVQVRRTAHGGKLEISFKDEDELQSLIKRFS